MKFSKIVLSSATALALGNAPQTNAATIEDPELKPKLELDEKQEIVPLIDWTGNSYLTRNTWSNVIGSNNLIEDYPTITNWAGNPGTAKFRIVNSKGAILVESGYVDAGKSVQLGPIPALSGTYTVQANVSKTGSYTITVD